MAQVTAQMVKELRERTQAGMSDCKAALVEAEGDMEKAIEIIQKKGLAKSVKRAGAAATEGEVRALVFASGKAGVMVEVNSQTDFVARNDSFMAFVGDLLQVASKTAPGANLSEQPMGSGKTVEETRAELSGTIGENIQVRRWERFDAQGPGLIHSYVHMGGKIGVLIEIGTESDAVASHEAVIRFADDTAMQIAAMSAQFLDRSQVPADMLDKQGEIFLALMQKEKEEGTLKAPEASWPKIIEGKKSKWCTEVCLLDQESIIVPGSSVAKLLEQLSKDVGSPVSIRRFTRFERGEGISKKSDDFAAEVAKMAGA
jgi:elongation factor Ts